jgi:hypothetical protein
MKVPEGVKVYSSSCGKPLFPGSVVPDNIVGSKGNENLEKTINKGAENYKKGVESQKSEQEKRDAEAKKADDLRKAEAEKKAEEDRKKKEAEGNKGNDK